LNTVSDVDIAASVCTTFYICMASWCHKIQDILCRRSDFIAHIQSVCHGLCQLHIKCMYVELRVSAPGFKCRDMNMLSGISLEKQGDGTSLCWKRNSQEEWGLKLSTHGCQSGRCPS